MKVTGRVQLCASTHYDHEIEAIFVAFIRHVREYKGQLLIPDEPACTNSEFHNDVNLAFRARVFRR